MKLNGSSVRLQQLKLCPFEVLGNYILANICCIVYEMHYTLSGLKAINDL